MTRARLPRRLARGWPFLVLVVVVALAVGLGAFDRRSDALVPRAPGEDVDTGNLVFAFRSASVQKATDFAGRNVWKLLVSGRVRNPHDEALAPISGEYGNLVLHDRASGRTAEPDSVVLGNSTSRTYVPPGNSWVEVNAGFTLPVEYSPGPDIELGLIPMEYTDNAILGIGGTRKWNVDSFAPASVVTLPLSRLPDAER